MFEIKIVQSVGINTNGNAPMYLQLPLQQWGVGNVYLLVLSKARGKHW